MEIYVPSTSPDLKTVHLFDDRTTHSVLSLVSVQLTQFLANPEVLVKDFSP